MQRLTVARHLSETASHRGSAHRRDGISAPTAAFDVILFEMQLPDDDGLGFARAIRRDSALSGTRLLLLTSFGRRRQDVAAFQTAGIDAFVMKPLRRTHLCDSVARLLTVESVPAMTHVVEEEQPRVSRARVLVVEDNNVNQLVALGQLQRLGHECIIAAGGRAALELIRTEPFDLVLMDCQMPDMAG